MIFRYQPTASRYTKQAPSSTFSITHLTVELVDKSTESPKICSSWPASAARDLAAKRTEVDQFCSVLIHPR